MTSRLIQSLVSLVFASGPYLGACAELLSGSVYDLGGKNVASSGIAGVSVTVRDSKEQDVGSGITDGKGVYSIEVRAPAGGVLFAYYEKIGYFAYPTIRQVSSMKGAQPPVALSKGSASGEYYKTVVAYVAQANAENPKGSALVIAGLAGLPTGDRAKVMEQLKANSSPSLFAEFVVADKTSQSSAKVLEMLNYTGIADYKGIKAYPNFPQTGSIRLYGYVSDPSHVKAVESIAKSVEGVKAVKNDVKVRGQP